MFRTSSDHHHQVVYNKTSIRKTDELSNMVKFWSIQYRLILHNYLSENL